MTIRDGEPGTATPTYTHLLGSKIRALDYYQPLYSLGEGRTFFSFLLLLLLLLLRLLLS